MILSFRDKETERFASGLRVKRWESFRLQGERRLRILEAATCLEDLRALPSSRLEALQGDRLGQYSIRINAQWRLCFEWPSGSAGPQNVEIVDDH